MADMKGVELARPGEWPLASGRTRFTVAHLKDAAEFFKATGGQKIPLALGHSDPRFTGDPAFGAVANVRYEEDDRGPVLKGDLVDMPQWLHAAAPKRWPNRSIEGFEDFRYNGRNYKLVLTALALLGATPPGVRSISSLQDLQLALTASSARRIVATPPESDPPGGEMTNPWGSSDPITWARLTGRIAASSERAWRADHLRDPECTEYWLGQLYPLPGVAGLQAAAGDADPDDDLEYAHLFPPTREALRASLSDLAEDAEFGHLFRPLH